MSQEKNNKVNTAKNEGYSDVYESCSICGRDMSNPKYIFVEVDSDLYICAICKKKHNIHAVQCAEI